MWSERKTRILGLQSMSVAVYDNSANLYTFNLKHKFQTSIWQKTCKKNLQHKKLWELNKIKN
ncbi:hypothetical protein BpHYR1_014236 [Brachionus plicatilis]|uniref:Uncharacterized protein n=1 Tax=Brachionus plicatilis TaxID=10195 RepID=A0A3M7SBL5_BRAPC|nr:hypothetical protein BpHYR1_014236 [Brachionus plicatilis]